MPAFGGAASNQVLTFMFGYGRTSGLPYDEYSQVGLDYAIMWWNPTDSRARARSSSTTAPAGSCTSTTPSATTPASGRRASPKLFDPSNSISQFDSLPESDAVPDYPCKGCPSSSTAS